MYDTKNINDLTHSKMNFILTKSLLVWFTLKMQSIYITIKDYIYL